jgi:CBS domain-containing protein
MRAKDVMTKDVVTASPETAVNEIARRLAAQRISAVPIVDAKGAVVGIVSEGDLMRRSEIGTIGRRSWWLELVSSPETLAGSYTKMHARAAKDVMTTPVVTAGEEMELSELAELLERGRIKRVPILRDGKLVGIVSRGNLVQALASAGTETPSRVGSKDETIREQLLAKLKSEPWASIAMKNVVVTEGTVHLWGIVESEEERRALRVAAETVPGVRGVEDHLTRADRLRAHGGL